MISFESPLREGCDPFWGTFCVCVCGGVALHSVKFPPSSKKKFHRSTGTNIIKNPRGALKFFGFEVLFLLSRK